MKCNNNVIISIVIPAYNIESYLRRCFDSVYSAISSNDEIILSLGDSTDATNVVATELSANRPNVQCIRQSGRGLSNARNSAMEHVAGDYVLFIDGDDYVDTVSLTKVLSLLRNGVISAEIVMSDFFLVVAGKEHISRVYQVGDESRQGLEHMEQVLKGRQSFFNSWRYIFLVSFLKTNKLQFLEGYYAEDVDFIIRCFLKRPRVFFNNAPYYYYVIDRPNSLMNSGDSLKRLSDTVYVLKSMIEKLKDPASSLEKVLRNKLQWEYVVSVKELKRLSYSERGAGVVLYNDFQKIVSPSDDFAVHVFAWLQPIIGVLGISQLLNMIRYVRRVIKGRVTKY